MGFWCFTFGLPGTRNSLEKPRLMDYFLWWMNEWFSFDTPVMVMFVHSCIPCILPCKYHANILNSIRFAVLPFWPLPSTCLNNFLGDLLKIAVYIFMCCEQELQATGFRIDQQMRDAKLLGLTQVGSRPESFSIPNFLGGRFFRCEKIHPPFFGTYQQIKDDRYIWQWGSDLLWFISLPLIPSTIKGIIENHYPTWPENLEDWEVSGEPEFQPWPEKLWTA